MSQASVLLSSISSANKQITSFDYGTFTLKTIEGEGFYLLY